MYSNSVRSEIAMEPQFQAAGLGSIGFPTLPILGFVQHHLGCHCMLLYANIKEMEMMSVTIGFAFALFFGWST